jgi:DNA-binding NtrC family response regulator
VTASSTGPNPTPSAVLPSLSEDEPSATHTVAEDEPAVRRSLVPVLETLASLPYAEAKRRLVAHFDELYTGELLRKTGGNMSEAARRAGLDRSNFRRLLKRHKDDE